MHRIRLVGHSLENRDMLALLVESVAINTGIPDPPDLSSGPQLTSWAQQRSDLRRIEVHFSEQVESVGVDDLILTSLGFDANDGVATAVALDADHVSTAGDTVVLQFSQHELPQGVLQLSVLPTVRSINGDEFDGNGDGATGDAYIYSATADNRFFRLLGDLNGDGGVTIFDFPAFNYWFGQAVGDFYAALDGDGGIGIFDFGEFARNFGQTISYAEEVATGQSRFRDGDVLNSFVTDTRDERDDIFARDHWLDMEGEDPFTEQSK